MAHLKNLTGSNDRLKKQVTELSARFARYRSGEHSDCQLSSAAEIFNCVKLVAANMKIRLILVYLKQEYVRSKVYRKSNLYYNN